MDLAPDQRDYRYADCGDANPELSTYEATLMFGSLGAMGFGTTMRFRSITLTVTMCVVLSANPICNKT